MLFHDLAHAPVALMQFALVLVHERTTVFHGVRIVVMAQ